MNDDSPLARHQPQAGVIFEVHSLDDGRLLDRVSLTPHLFIVIEGAAGVRVVELGAVSDLLVPWALRCLMPEPGCTPGPVGLRMAENLFKLRPALVA